MVKILEFVFTFQFIAGLVIGAIGGFVAEFFVARNNKKLLEQAQAALTTAQSQAKQLSSIIGK
jgi:gas vesicle protein